MAKIRHIAYRAEDLEAMAKFFVEAFDMSVVQRRPRGAIDLTDGTLNITLLPANGPGSTGIMGIEHIGFSAADDEAAKRKIIAAGGVERNTVNLGSHVHFEVKYEGPEGIVVDLGHWAGTEAVQDNAGAPVVAAAHSS
jgi:catechol 2,3-dioxygenase-like lactoylglutathione lyase family enzyme